MGLKRAMDIIPFLGSWPWLPFEKPISILYVHDCTVFPFGLSFAFVVFGLAWCPIGVAGSFSWAPNKFPFRSSITESYPRSWKVLIQSFRVNCLILLFWINLDQPASLQGAGAGLLCIFPGQFLRKELVAASSKRCPLVRAGTLDFKIALNNEKHWAMLNRSV